MNKPLLAFTRFVQDECAVTAIEYALIASLIAVVIVVAVGNTGTSVNGLLSRVADCVTKAASGNAC